MAEHDDAESPIGEREGDSTRHVRARGNPIATAWAWFNAQPAQTKVIIVGVIVVIGVVAWMALRNKNTSDTSQEDVSPGKFRPLGASSPAATPAPATATPPTSQPAATAPSVASSIVPGGGTPRPVTMTANPNTAGPLVPPTQVLAPAAVRPANTYAVTPEGMSPTFRGTDISLSGTIIPINGAPTVVKATGLRQTVVDTGRKGPTPQTTRPTVITPIPTQRGTNISI